MLNKTFKLLLTTTLLLITITTDWQTSNAGKLSTTTPSRATPIANDDTYDTYLNTPLSVPANGVLNNDFDPDGDTLTSRLLTTVTTGTLTFNDDGSFDYNPPTDFLGVVTFTYEINDGIVGNEQKISDLEGGFTGILDNEDKLGRSVTNIDDLDGDGVADIAVGAHLDDDGGTDTGAVWILFLNSDGTVKSHQKISDTAGSFTGVLDNVDYFGVSVASLGDLDGDTIPDIAVGAYRDDDGGSEQGAIWILFLNTDGTVKSHQKISDTTGSFTGSLSYQDYFGRSVTPIGDLDGDSILDIAVGAYHDNDGGTNIGAIWVLFLNSDGTVKAHQKISDTQGNFNGELDNSDVFGIAMSRIGDLNGDSIPDLAIGAASDDDGGTGRGAIWILFLNTNGTVKNHQKISDTQGNFRGGLHNSDGFGKSITNVDSLAGTQGAILVTGITDDDGGTNRGGTWVLFLKDIGTDTATVTINVRPACAGTSANAVHVDPNHTSPNLTLNWIHDPFNLGGYAVYRHTTPYFDPSTAGTLVTFLITGSTTYTDLGITGNPADNYYYTLRAYNCDASRFADSNHIAEFDFALMTPP